MAELSREDIIAAIQAALVDHPCRFDLSPKDVDHLIGMVTDIGEGSIRAGVERMRRHHLWLVDRLKVDAEFSANHAAMTGARDVASTFGKKLALFGMFVITLMIAAAMLGYSLSKFGNLKFGD